MVSSQSRLSTVALAPNLAFVGALADDQNGEDAGAVHVYVQTGTTWSLQKKLLGHHAGDLFGYALAASDQNILVGAAGVSDHGDLSGAVFPYYFSGTNLTEMPKLFADDAAENALFGTSVAVNGLNALVGASGRITSGPDSGGAYVFTLPTYVTVSAPALGHTPALGLVALSLVLVLIGLRRRVRLTV